MQGMQTRKRSAMLVSLLSTVMAGVLLVSGCSKSEAPSAPLPDATALLKHDPLTAHIPVIALTAMAMKEDREKTRLAGCDAYIIKPLRYKELYQVIDTLLQNNITPLT